MKLGQKKNKSGGTDSGAKKAEKKGKRKSKGSGNGLANAKTFLANHVEKLILAAIAVVSLMLIISGFSKKGFDKDPETVRQAIDRAKRQIESSTWAQVRAERLPEPDTFQERAALDSIDIDRSAYVANMPFHPRMRLPSKKRSDPEILAPIQLEVDAGYGALAVKGESELGLGSRFGRRDEGRSIESDQRIGNVSLGGQYESEYFVVITGLVPYQKQFNLYVDAFQGAQDYQIDRDVPNYVFLEVQRAEVDPDGSLGEWVTLDAAKTEQDMATRWQNRTEQFVDPEYIITKNIVMPLPPIAQRDLTQWATHSDVPLERSGSGEQGRTGRPNAGEREFREGRGPDGRLGRDERGDQRESEMTDGGDSYVEQPKPAITVDHGLMRYVDMTVEPGKSYKYRVQLVLDDPNNPATDEFKRPPADACETEVLVRLQTSNDKWRRSDWSEPSDEVVVPTGSQVFASKVARPRTRSLSSTGRGSNIRLPLRPGEEPEIELLTLSWDAQNTRDVPIIVKARRGSVLNGQVEETEAIDPSQGKILPVTNYRYQTNAVVLDIAGGGSLGDNLVAPGAMLIMKDGKLTVRREIEDQDEFESHKIEPQVEERRFDEPADDEDRNRRREGPGRSFE